MNRFSHDTLIHIATDLVSGTSVMQKIIAEMQDIGKVLAISSIYKRYVGSVRADLNANIEVVVRLGTDCAIDELLWHCKRLLRDQKATLSLLSYDDLVVLSPQLTLPHPWLHTDQLIIRCASEAWEQYEHPIVQKPLQEIAAHSPPAADAEFYSQGKTLVDF